MAHGLMHRPRVRSLYTIATARRRPNGRRRSRGVPGEATGGFPYPCRPGVFGARAGPDTGGLPYMCRPRVFGARAGPDTVGFPYPCRPEMLTRRSRLALATTEIELVAMATSANTGCIIPNTAKGIMTTL